VSLGVSFTILAVFLGLVLRELNPWHPAALGFHVRHEMFSLKGQQLSMALSVYCGAVSVLVWHLMTSLFGGNGPFAGMAAAGLVGAALAWLIGGGRMGAAVGSVLGPLWCGLAALLTNGASSVVSGARRNLNPRRIHSHSNLV
jgi:hypothetical protein